MNSKQAAFSEDCLLGSSAYCPPTTIQQTSNRMCFAETGGVNGLLLIKPNEPMEKRHRRIKQLVEDMPAVLKAAEEAEAAAAAAAAKASQTELPSPEKVLLPLRQPDLQIDSILFCMFRYTVRQHCQTCVEALFAVAGIQLCRDGIRPVSAASMHARYPLLYQQACNGLALSAD